MIFGLYTRIAAIAVLAVVLAGFGWKLRHGGVVAGRAEVQAKWDIQTAEEIKQQAEAKAKADADTKSLQDKADTNRRKSNAEILALNIRLGEYASRLSNRPERPDPGSVPAITGLGASGCTPSQLYRSDAILALQIAADADRLRIGLQACQSAYEAARALK